MKGLFAFLALLLSFSRFANTSVKLVSTSSASSATSLKITDDRHLVSYDASHSFSIDISDWLFRKMPEGVTSNDVFFAAAPDYISDRSEDSSYLRIETWDEKIVLADAYIDSGPETQPVYASSLWSPTEVSWIFQSLTATESEASAFQRAQTISLSRLKNQRKHTQNLRSVGTARTIDETLLERYTSRTAYIRNYSVDFSNYMVNGTIDVDSIIKLIPEELFFSNREVIYAGSAYGFYISSIQYPTLIDPYMTSRYYCDVLVFQILETFPSPFGSNQSEAKIEVIPKAGARYCAATADCAPCTAWGVNFNPNSDEVLYPSDALDIYLSNVQFACYLGNQNAANYGDDDYVVENDSGDFIIQSRYFYEGNYQRNISQPLSAESVFSSISYVSSVISTLAGFSFGPDGVIISTIANYVSLTTGAIAATLHSSTFSTVSCDGEAMIDTLPTSAYAQRTQYGHLIKEMTLSMDEESSNPVLFGTTTENNHVGAAFVFSSSAQNGPTEETNIVFGLSFEVVYDGSTQVSSSELTDLSHFSWLRGFSTYQRVIPTYGENSIETLDFRPGGTVRFKFVGDDDPYHIFGRAPFKMEGTLYSEDGNELYHDPGDRSADDQSFDLGTRFCGWDEMYYIVLSPVITSSSGTLTLHFEVV